VRRQPFLDASGLPFATMFGDKSVLSEDHPGYIGMYSGRLMEEPVRAFVESCDVVVMLGAVLTDGNTAGNTVRPVAVPVDRLNAGRDLAPPS